MSTSSKSNNYSPPESAPGQGTSIGGTGMGAKDTKKTVKRLLSYIGNGHKVQFGVVIVCIIISSIATVYGSVFLKSLVDDYVEPLIGSAGPYTELLNAICILAFIYAFGLLTSVIYNRVMVIIAQSILHEIRGDMFNHMQDLPIRYFDTHTHGDIMSHYTNDTDTLRQMMAQSVPQMISSAITVVAILAAMLYMSWQLTLVVLVSLLIMMFSVKKLGGKSSSFFLKQQDSMGETNGYVEEMINGQKVIKVFCHEEESENDFDKNNDELFENASKANGIANILMPLMINVGNLQYVLIAIIGGLLCCLEGDASSITLGTIISFLGLSKSFTMPVSQVSQQINFIVMALAGAERIFELIDEPVEEDEGRVTLVNAKIDGDEIVETNEHTGTWAWKRPLPDGTEYTHVKGDVQMFEVDFAYEENNPVLHDVSLYAKPGQKIAFVGATGAGKTTITNLINRFYDIADGKIRYDGININHIKKADLRRSLGIVLQDVNLFTGTVMENIRYGKLDATDDEVIKAAQKANADGFITMLPHGYNTVLKGDGSGLSQGQRQLISIARAAIADPPVMILDEATSSIDTRTEAIVQRGMDSLMHGRTVFVIAHRLSTVQNADSIMVLELGRIIERGSHESLIAQHGKYYQLYTGAFELE